MTDDQQIARVERDVTTLFRDKASRREHDALARRVEQVDEAVDGKADKADVTGIRTEMEALRRAIVGGSISICVVVLGSAAAYYFFTAHP